MNEEKGVQSIERALDIIESVAEAQKGKTLTEISCSTGLHKSTVYRILTTLMRRGYLTRGDEGNYKIGHKMIEVISYYISDIEIQTEARPYITEISEYLGMGAYLGILEGDKVIYVEKANVSGAVSTFTSIGVRTPSYCTAMGKCLLSGLSKAELEETMKDCSFIKFTPNTLNSMQLLQKEIEKVRKQGWAIDDEEYETGHRCIGAPVYDYKGDIVAAVSTCGEIHILTDERIQRTAEYIKKMAGEISKKLGYDM